jgi:[NiFe] hydrogenase assembly HybE family chaperone
MRDAGDIARELETAFSRVHKERMNGIPILNPRLHVEAIGTRAWGGYWLSVLVTPWFINLMLLPQDDGEAPVWDSLATGEKILQRFPAGRFEFIAGEETGLGRYLMCSLFSPVLEFEDQEAARIAATASLEALFDAEIDSTNDGEAKAEKSEPATSTPPGTRAPDAPPEMSRRAFFTGGTRSEEGAS